MQRNPMMVAALAGAGLLAAIALGVVVRGTSTPEVEPPTEATEAKPAPTDEGSTAKAPAAPAKAAASAPQQVDESAYTTTESGLKYHDFQVGTGASPKPGDVVSVHYTGWLPDGTKFDSSLDRGQPIQFPLGQGRVIKGWDEGIASMKEGGRRQLVIPPELGYGARGFPPVIPPASTLIFEVELVDVP